MLRFIVPAIIFLSGIILAADAQDSISNVNGANKYYHSFQMSVENGILLANEKEESEDVINSSYYNGLEVRYGWHRKDTTNIYNRLYRFPVMGLGWYSSTFHNSEVGKPNALFFFFTVPIFFEGNKKLTASYTGAFGISYNFNPYDSLTNPENIFIGTYKNCYVHFGVNLEYHFTNHFNVLFSTGLKHFSNGSYKKPNYGINLFPFALGMRYKLSDVVNKKPVGPVTRFTSYNQFNVMFAAGSKNYTIGSDNYLKMTFGLNYLRQMGYRYRMGVGLDVFYSAGAGYRNGYDESAFSKSISYAIVGSWEWVLNRVVCFPLGLGYYLHRSTANGEFEPYYERIGVRFSLTEHLKAGLTAKAHGTSADFFEWTLAYTLHRDPNLYR